MRTIVLLMGLLLIPGAAGAQSTPAADGGGRLRGSRGLHVAVIDGESREWQGRLLEVARDAITLEIGSDARRFEMTNVKRVDAHGDKVWDGALKGVAFGAVMAVLVGVPRFAGQAGLTYGLIGLGLDALNHCQHTIYRAPATAAGVSVSW
jgi:hypothetical protein